MALKFRWVNRLTRALDAGMGRVLLDVGSVALLVGVDLRLPHSIILIDPGIVAGAFGTAAGGRHRGHFFFLGQARLLVTCAMRPNGRCMAWAPLRDTRTLPPCPTLPETSPGPETRPSVMVRGYCAVGVQLPAEVTMVTFQSPSKFESAAAGATMAAAAKNPRTKLLRLNMSFIFL